MKFTLRLIREVSRLMPRAPAKQVASDYGISLSSALRMDRWVLSQEMPQPCMDGVDAIIVDEMHLGAILLLC